MRFTVATVAMVMLCVMAIHADVKPQKDFNLQKFTGKWYRVGFAYDSPGFAPYRDKLRASMGMITQMPDGNANLTMWELSPLGCQSLMYQYNKTNVPGEFIYFSTRHNMLKDITVVDTNYTEYALVLKHKGCLFSVPCSTISVLPFAGRTPRVRYNILQKFKAFSLSQGLPKESILVPPPAENCPTSESAQ
ncbi:neutrophil gelatinase-associated lipocalin isoform X1 [Oryzias latipes]|uniref:neutrophil gelatinase-associated lipocalin isoform X1 n=1 Tax=Oryzias latipes TaxID=8090 RepID=UPI0009DAA62C|nr:neutrophil gelatinase-associated lipocalin isoform X1 [Oryzias latipes]XP_020563405.1 neutrophil gelatinase-associated lipocalin isoform X1 [Oryzias latipes]